MNRIHSFMFPASNTRAWHSSLLTIHLFSPFLSLLFFTLALSHAEDRPNIIFLMSDDQTTYSMGCYGTPDVKTPNLDKLATAGMVFDNHYDTTAICMASRASVMTGMFEYKTGCNFSHGPLMMEHWSKTYPVLLRKAGYITAFAGKFGFVVKTENNGKSIPEKDFDRWGGGPGQTHYQTKTNRSIAHYASEYPHATLAYGAFGRDFIKDAARSGKPFCLSISFKAPHRPVSPDPKFDHVYANQKFTKPKNYGREFGEHFSEQSRRGRQFARFSGWDYDKDYDRVMARYHQQIYAIDYAVGMIREALDKHGVTENTVIIYTSDNGFLCGSHGYGSKVLPYEEASRVPLIIYDPRHKNSGRRLRSQALTGNVDFAPTILALAGLPAPKNIDGKSLLPLYSNPATSIHESLPLINVWGPAATHSLAIVTKDWKYIFWGYAEGDLKPAEELYHTDKDPLEFTNQAGNPEYAEALKTMRRNYDAALDRWKKEAVEYHGYKKFGVLFDREITWVKKQQLLKN
ncbi:MAG: sulfatase [Planctomycetota bacterium]|nr:sulfatase [Planctomycetota bacterium]